MTPRSKAKIDLYVDQVLNVKACFTEDIFEEESIIFEHQSSYSVTKLKSVTMKLLDDVIVFDDNKFVTIINAPTMQKIAQVPMPNENTYLYAVYNHGPSKTIMLSFENKLILGIDSQKYTAKCRLPIDSCCLTFTEVHSDPENFVIMGCERGVLKIMQPARNLVVSQFDMESAFREELAGQGMEENMNEESEVGDILEVIKTVDIKDTDQYIIIATNGLFFVTIRQNKGAGKGFLFELDTQEFYFKGEKVKGTYEYTKDKIIAVIEGSKQIRFIDRKYQREDMTCKI